MIHFFKEIGVLHREGKLHKKLIIRVRMLFIISLILGGVVAYNLIFAGVNAAVAGALAGIGFILGFYIFSRMNVINWNEGEEIVEAARMDRLGYITLGLYILFEISFRTLLKDFFPASATAYLLAGIFGTLLGRAVGTVVEIHNVYKKTHPSEPVKI